VLDVKITRKRFLAGTAALTLLPVAGAQADTCPQGLTFDTAKTTTFDAMSSCTFSSVR
jgi:hypothetical protein